MPPTVPMPKAAPPAPQRGKAAGREACARADAAIGRGAAETGRSTGSDAAGRRPGRRGQARHAANSADPTDASGAGAGVAPRREPLPPDKGQEQKNAPVSRGVFVFRNWCESSALGGDLLGGAFDHRRGLARWWRSECCGASWPRESRERDRRGADRSRARRFSRPRNRQAGRRVRRRAPRCRDRAPRTCPCRSHWRISRP